MSAVIQNEYTGNNSTTTYSFTFPYLKTSDIKASLDGVATTAFTLPNATTLQFNTAPPQDAKIKIFRETSVDDLTATFYAGSAIKSEDLNDNFTQNLYKTQEVGARSLNTLGGTMTGDLNIGEATVIKFEGATDDAHETTLTVADPTADRTITLPNVTGTVVTTGDTGTVATGMIAGDAVNGDKIADNAINSEHYTDGSIDRVHLAADIVDGTKIADDSVDSEHLVADSIDTEHYAAGSVDATALGSNAVTRVKIIADAVDGTKIADNSIDSEHYVNGSIDNEHIADNAINQAKMADDSIGAAEIIDNAVGSAALASNSVTNVKMADNAIGTSELVNDAVVADKIAANAVTRAKIIADAVDGTKIADNAIGNEHLQDDSVRSAEIQAGAVGSTEIASSAVIEAKIANDAVTTNKIVNDAITSAKIADDAVGSSELGDGVIDTIHVGAGQITSPKIANSGVESSNIQNLAVVEGKIADNAVTIGKIGCEQTTISDSDSHIPTSGAVVDYVAAQIAPLGGLEVIATEVAFPNTQPSSGVVISISDAGGVVVNGSGVSTTGRTVGGSTVTINGFPASLQSKTMAAGLGLMVSSTGSSQTYTYHKLLAKEADVEQLSNDINDFASRYRVGSSNPTSSLDNGDLFFNTGTGKMLVYNGTNTAWEEVQSIGNFFISTFSEAFDGSRTQFTLSNAPTNVQQVLLSLNGVVQKPGTAFTLSGSTVTLASAPASGTDYFAVVMGSTVNIGTPSNDTVSTAILQDDSVNADKIAAGAVGSTELAANAVINSKIADSSISNAKVSGSAAIAGSKINPSFTSDITVTAGEGASAVLNLIADEGDDNGDGWKIQSEQDENDLTFKSNISGSYVDKLKLKSSGQLEVQGNLVATGNITVTGTVDGVDIANTLVKGNGSNNGTTEINVADADFIVEDTTDGTTNFIWRDHSDSKLYLGTSAAVVTPRSSVIPQADSTYNLGTSSVRWANVYADTLYGDGSNLTGINTDLVSDTSPQLGGDLQSNGNDIDIADNDYLYVGNDNNLKIYHTGSHSYIDQTASSGDLYIRQYGTSNSILFNGANAETLAKFTHNGSCELYHDNSKKLQTQSGGVRVYGDLENHDNNFVAKDSCKFTAGNSEDLQIYHDGSNSFIKDNGTGNLKIQSNATLVLGDPTGNIDYAKFINGGYSEIYGNNTKRFETTSYGTKVFGYQSSSSYVGFHVFGSLNNAGFGTDHGSSLTTYDVNYYSPIPMFSSKTIDYGSSYLDFPSYAGGNYVKFTAPVSGLYQLELMASVETHHGGDWFAFGWEVNTTTNSSNGNFANNGRGICAVYERAGGDEGAGCHFSTTIYLSANDYAILYQQSAHKIRWKGNQYYVRGHLIH